MNGVTTIGEAAFARCSALGSIEIPAEVTSIGSMAFHSCSSLAAVTIKGDSKLETIGISAFHSCINLKGIEIPAEVTSINDMAFNGCSSLAAVTFAPDSQLETIGANAFNSCASLKSIEISSVNSIGANAFPNCPKLTTVEYYGTPEDWKNISGKESNSKLRCIAKENGLKFELQADNISWKVTDGSKAAGEITIPETVQKLPVTTIGSSAFAGSAVTGVTIPQSVTKIEESAFSGCTQLKEVTVPSTVTSIGRNAFTPESKVYFTGTQEQWQQADGQTAGGTVHYVTIAKVTFQVKNGTWADNTTAEKQVQVRLVNGKGKMTANQIPTGMKAAAGFEGGAWNKDPAATGITAAATFTYTFTRSVPGENKPAPAPAARPAAKPKPTPGIKTETLEDGSELVTETAEDGTVTETLKDKDGKTLEEKVTAPDGTVEKTVYHQDGKRTETKHDAGGNLLEEIVYNVNGSFVKTGFKPQVIEGADQSVQAGRAVSFRSDDAFVNFLHVLLDGEILDPRHYTAAEGSIRVTLEPEFAESLPAGQYSMGIVSTNGTAQCSFTVEQAADDGTDQAGAADKGFYWWLCLPVALVSILAIVIVKRRKKQ